MKPDSWDTLQFNPQEFKKLKKEYDKALKFNVESFYFQNKEILTGYAKYLIMHLETVFKEVK